ARGRDCASSNPPGGRGSARAEPREIRDPARRPGLASTLPLHAAFDPLAGEVVMHRSARPFVVVAIAIAGLAAVSSIAGARGRSAAALDPERLASLAAMDEALARQDFAAALALRIAETIAARHGDDEARARVRVAADRILRPAADLTRSAQPGS